MPASSGRLMFRARGAHRLTDGCLTLGARGTHQHARRRRSRRGLVSCPAVLDQQGDELGHHGHPLVAGRLVYSGKKTRDLGVDVRDSPWCWSLDRVIVLHARTRCCMGVRGSHRTAP